MLAETIRQKARTETKEAPDTESFRTWALAVPERKGPLDLDRYVFQRELYTQECCEHPNVVIPKATQIGISTYTLRWAMYYADYRGRNALYVFPKLKQMYDFSDARIKPAILGSPYLKTRIPADNVNNKGLRQIGTGFLYCRGGESTDDMQAVDADVLVADEYSDIKRENIPDMERRLGNSELGYMRRVGVPDIPNNGLDKLYRESDQRRWFVKCQSCGERQYLSYDQNVNEEKVRLECRKCHKGPLDVRQGEWVATYEGRDIRGYHMPRFIVPQDTEKLQDIITRHYQTSPSERKAHHNKDLGEAYAPEEGRLSLEAIKRAQREDIPLESPEGSAVGELRTMGVDVASVRDLNVRVSAHANGIKVPLFIGQVHDFNELMRIWKKYDVNFGCIDHEPDGRLSRAFAERFPGRCYLVASSGTQKDILKPDSKMRFVSVNRTILYDATFDAIRQQRNLLPAELPEGYADQMQNLVRVGEVDDEGKTKFYYRRMGEEDYAQAEMYDTVAEAVYWWLQDVEAGVQGEEFTMDERYDFERSNLDAPPGGVPRYVPGLDGEPG